MQRRSGCGLSARARRPRVRRADAHPAKRRATGLGSSRQNRPRAAKRKASVVTRPNPDLTRPRAGTRTASGRQACFVALPTRILTRPRAVAPHDRRGRGGALRRSWPAGRAGGRWGRARRATETRSELPKLRGAPTNHRAPRAPPRAERRPSKARRLGDGRGAQPDPLCLCFTAMPTASMPFFFTMPSTSTTIP